MTRGKFNGDVRGKLFYTESSGGLEHNARGVVEVDAIVAFKRFLDRHTE